MNDSEDYHTGRAAAYYTAVGLLRSGRSVRELLTELERLQLAAETTAEERAAEKRAQSVSSGA